MSEKDKNITPENEKDQEIPAPPANPPQPVKPAATVSKLDVIGKPEDWKKNWPETKSSNGFTWKVTKTYTKYKDCLIEYLQTAIDPKKSVGLKRKAARIFKQYSDKVTSQFEAVSKKQPLAGVSQRVAIASKELDLAKSSIKGIESDIDTLKKQIDTCKKYAEITTMEAMSKNSDISRPKSFGRGWLPENHQNETLEQIESGVGGKTKQKYKLDILSVLKIDPDSDVILFDGFDASKLTLGGLSSFFTERGKQLEEFLENAEKSLEDAKINKVYKEKDLFMANEDIKLAKKQLSADYNNRVRKAFRMGKEVIEGHLFNLLIGDDWTPMDGQIGSKYSKARSVNTLSRYISDALSKIKGMPEKTQRDIDKDSEKELSDSIAEGNKDVDDWKHLSKLWPGYVLLDKLLTSNYVVALMAQGSLDSQTFHIKKIDKSLKAEKIISIFLDARAKNAQSKFKELETAKEIENYLVGLGLSPEKGPFLVETHTLTKKPVLSKTAIKVGKLSKATIEDINNRLGLTSDKEENKAAKSKK
jgi:ribosomal protein S17E